jgi:GR25 family glycosyltransferase involved in LPS biosynthesis
MAVEIPTYVICLEKTRATRCGPTLQAWRNIANKYALAVQSVRATTPADFDLKDMVHPYAYSCILHKGRKTLEMIASKTEVACALSHIGIWRRVVASGRPSIVVEDDMAMSDKKMNRMLSQLKTMPDDTDMYLLHFLGMNLRYTKMAGGVLDVSSFAGLQAYYMTPSCAEKLLRYAFPLIFQVDTYVPRARDMLGLKIRTRISNQMTFGKFAKDNLASTLGKNHVSSVMLSMAIALTVIVLVIVVGVVVWAVQTYRNRHVLRECERKQRK